MPGLRSAIRTSRRRVARVVRTWQLGAWVPAATCSDALHHCVRHSPCTLVLDDEHDDQPDMTRKWEEYARFGLNAASTASSIGFSAAKVGVKLGVRREFLLRIFEVERDLLVRYH